MTGCGWLWLYAGAVLMLMEILSPGFVIFFFGLSAATTGLLRLAIGEPFGATWQTVAFSALTIVYLVFFRRALKSVFSGRTERTATDFEDDFAGRVGKVTEAIEPPLSGRVEIGDAEWSAFADSPVAAGRSVRVASRDNLTVRVEPL